MKEKPEEVVAVTNLKYLLFLLLLSTWSIGAFTQEYTKRVLESTEVDILMGYYEQDGNHAAVSGGLGEERLTDISPSIIVSVPLSADEILRIDATVSAYTSASSSNINPFDGKGKADPFVASTGASSNDLWFNSNLSYTKYSDDRNKIHSLKVSISNEFDYSSIGIGGSTSRLFNEKNTEIGISANAFFDQWRIIYPYELRYYEELGSASKASIGDSYTITGYSAYQPNFNTLNSDKRNSISGGIILSQILSRSMQGSLLFDLIYQSGLLSTPFHRVYFADVSNSYIDNFHLADDIERLPGNRLKMAFGGRLNTYINEFLVLRSYMRYYQDDWGITSYTAQFELPIKLFGKYTIYPAYRYYSQTAADYFAPYDQHLSSQRYYTSDYDLSDFNSNQYSLGFRYNDLLGEKHISIFAIKALDLNFSYYERNINFKAFVVSTGISLVLDP